MFTCHMLIHGQKKIRKTYKLRIKDFHFKIFTYHLFILCTFFFKNFISNGKLYAF